MNNTNIFQNKKALANICVIEYSQNTYKHKGEDFFLCLGLFRGFP